MTEDLECLRRVGLTAIEIYCLACSYYDGVSQRDIAHRLKMDVSTVCRILAHGRAKLAKNQMHLPDLERGRPPRHRPQVTDPHEMDGYAPCEMAGAV